MRRKNASGPSLPGSQITVRRLEAAGACLLGERGHREPADALALGIGGDGHAPDAAAELVAARCLGVEVAADEADDLVAVEHDARPRRRRIDVRIGDRVRDGSDELLLAGRRVRVFAADDRRRGQFFQSEVTHDEG